MVTEEDDTYNADEIEESITNLTEAAGNLGFAFVDIRPRVDKDVEKRIINLSYDIQEGPKVFVERIEIEGNERTLDKVIRREFRLVEGDAFNATACAARAAGSEPRLLPDGYRGHRGGQPGRPLGGPGGRRGTADR